MEREREGRYGVLPYCLRWGTLMTEGEEGEGGDMREERSKDWEDYSRSAHVLLEETEYGNEWEKERKKRNEHVN